MFSFVQCLDRVTAPIHIYMRLEQKKIKPGCSLPPPLELLDGMYALVNYVC